MIGPLSDYRDVYMAACGAVFASHAQGLDHERHCAACRKDGEPCRVCGGPGVNRYSVDLICMHGIEEGLHLADVEVWLCPKCVDVVADRLKNVVEPRAGSEGP